MDIHLLEDIGLTRSQAAAYQSLVRGGANTAPAIASNIHESRSNAYKILDRLCDLGLANKSTIGKKVTYFPASPTALEQLLQREAALVSLKERKLKAAMPDLMTFFQAHSEQPGVRFYQGVEGVKQIFEDQVKTGKPLYHLRSLDDVKFFAPTDLHALRNAFPERLIRRYAITQDHTPFIDVPKEERVPIAESDAATLLARTWIDPEDYSEPVEWTAYGDKLSIMSYGKEAIGMVIESPQIAAAFRRIFALLDEGIRRRPGYSLRPLRTTYTAMPDKMRRKLKSKDR